MMDVLAQDQPQVPLTGDQHPVQALTAGTGDPSFGYRVRARRLDRCLDDPCADGGEHRVERRSELGVPVTDHELDDARAALQAHQEIPGLLSDPTPPSGAR
jgi:hypothetical protein